MKLLLDTNVVVWLLLGDKKAIPERVVSELENVDNAILVSAASIWEIALKVSLEKLRFPVNWRDALSRLDFEQLPITGEHAAGVQFLPWLHRDPFDRLLVAQAVAEQCRLVTADRALDAYPVETLWA